MGKRDVLLNIIMYFNKIHDRPLDGRKKLQKLLFLVEHLDPESGRLSKSRGLTGYKFVVWSYGPFSKEVYNDLRMLVREGLVEERVETIRLSRYYSYFGSYGDNGCFGGFGAWVRFINPLQYNG